MKMITITLPRVELAAAIVAVTKELASIPARGEADPGNEDIFEAMRELFAATLVTLHMQAELNKGV